MIKKKTKTTYGVYNLIEWHALLRLGKATVKVHFTGGSITTQGVTPATFTTEDPVIQFAIERSPEFIAGKIKPIRRVDVNGVVEIESNVPNAVPGVSTDAPASIPTARTAAATEETQGSPDMPTAHEVKGSDNAETAPGAPTTEPLPEKQESVTTMTQVEFSCNDDAKDYLEQTFGLVRSRLRNREDIVAAGKARGVEIIFL